MKKRGAPLGNRYSAHDKPWTNALQRALARYEDPTEKIKAAQALNRIADKTVKAALEGDKDARKEIAERLDGRPIQPIAAQVETTVTVEIARYGSGKAP